MISLLEVCKRAESGPSISAENFDLDVVFQNANNLCKKYDINYDANNPVPSDDDLADRIFQAGVDFFCQTGIYCNDTQKLIQFSREEVFEAIKTAPGRCIFGEGNEKYIFTPRKPDSDTKPWFHTGTGIMTTDERIVFNLVKEYGNIKQANSISCPAFESIEGQTIKTDTPTEIYGAIRGIKIARDALRHAGRPGLAIANCISTAGGALSTIAASAPQFGLRRSDGWLVGALAEMKIDYGFLNKAAYLSNWGANICSESGPLVGGYAGGPAGTAILNVAYMLMGRLVLNCNYHLIFPTHITKACSSNSEVLWCVATSAQAISRNMKEPVLFLGYMAAGPMTKQFYYESAAYIATAISSGVSTQTCHPARAILNDYITPMEMRGTVELAEACAGMKRSQANEIVKQLLPKYENNLDNAPIGKKYQECYDINTGKPNQEYVNLYAEVKEEIKSLGIEY